MKKGEIALRRADLLEKGFARPQIGLESSKIKQKTPGASKLKRIPAEEKSPDLFLVSGVPLQEMLAGLEELGTLATGKDCNRAQKHNKLAYCSQNLSHNPNFPGAYWSKLPESAHCPLPYKHRHNNRRPPRISEAER